MSERKSQQGGGLFSDVNALRNGGGEEEEDEEEKERAKYDPNSLCGRIARSKPFEYSSLGIVCFNALYLGYDCDYNARWGKPEDLYASSLYGFIVLDNFFCLFFTGELIIRLIGYKEPMNAFLEKAFLFDLALVLMMIVETWVLAILGPIPAMKQASILRLLRLTRLFRMGKLMRYFPELQLIVKGMVAAVRSVACAAVLMLLVLYVFSIIFTNEYHQGHMADDDEDLPEVAFLFGSLGKSMRHLLIMATILDDITACVTAIRSSENMFMLMMFWACVLISSFTLFNMLLGILCEVVEATAEGERAKAEDLVLHETMLKFFAQMDTDKNGVITRQEFSLMSQDPKVSDHLDKLQIGRKSFEKYGELLFAPIDGKVPTLDYSEAINMMMRLRPGCTLNALDFGYFKAVILAGNKQIENYLNSLEEILVEAAGPIEEVPESESEPESPQSPPEEADEAEEVAPAKYDADRRRRLSSEDEKTLAVPGDKQVKKQILKADPKKRQGPHTFKSLARGRQAAFANIPSIETRWNAEDPVSPQSTSTSPSRSPVPRGARSAGHALASDRLSRLAEHRRLSIENRRAEVGHVSPKSPQRQLPVGSMIASMTYHNTVMNNQFSNNTLRQAGYANSNYINEADFAEGGDDDRPFSPQGFCFH